MEKETEKQLKDEELAKSLENKMEDVMSEEELENAEGGGNLGCQTNGNCKTCRPSHSQKELQDNTLL